jgi:hypothetical protein
MDCDARASMRHARRVRFTRSSNGRSLPRPQSVIRRLRPDLSPSEPTVASTSCDAALFRGSFVRIAENSQTPAFGHAPASWKLTTRHPH